MLAYLELAALCGFGLAAIVAADWYAHRPRRRAPPFDPRTDPRLAQFWADVDAALARERAADDWRQYHILWQAPPPSLIDDPHGPARCRCAHCQARRAATR